ncbi:dihydroorotate dehydrogenase electron transfer subunit [Endomicrobium proavitum]|uniref:Dihydroorotate dehydrogenase B (NAD(+)), electron transfer subunit n=1 Tax=Endomicrobium proavitum TaxID=1408281 RepID=A0A0G3WI93_9BACT|nr:dihydroorotate dehydrogenase electron transfer subunit [Endomicrobium proavitum]AKL98013.1 Dihydroorotate dehydrogenase electron transfer subunit [Endomicrobium proavitum]
MNKRQDKTYKIISNKEICAGYFELQVKADAVIVKNCSPGQFFMLTIPGVFLRRPISVHDIKGNIISFLYKVVGKGTKILSEIESGEINLLGPLGAGYPLIPNSSFLISNCRNIIVAGGTGIASVYYLAAKLKNKGTLYYGARTKKDLLCLDKFQKLGWKVVVSTEDGSKGHKGFITDVIARRIAKQSDAAIQTVIYVCGPTPMMKTVLKIAKEKNISGYASLEEKMACGVGNCQGCAVKINGKTKMTCKDGPVFKIEEIEL